MTVGNVLLLASIALLVPGCIPSNVVARADRVVRPDLDTVEFVPAVDLALTGYFSSDSITGDVALALRKVCYYFEQDGTYTAAALIDDGTEMAFQTLSGTWQLTPSGLSLDGAAEVTIEHAGDLVRLTTPQGRLVLRREEL